MLNLLLSKRLIKISECNFRKYMIRWQISKSTNVSDKFLYKLHSMTLTYLFESKKFKIFISLKR